MEMLESAMFLSDFYPMAAPGFCAWIAVITAVLSFWRIKAAGSSSRLKSDASSLADQTPISDSSTPTVCLSSVDQDDGLTKGKFTNFYYEDDGISEEEEDEVDGDAVSTSEMYGDDERVRAPVLRTSHWGRYPYQDLTGLDGGCVVRLWDHQRPNTLPLKLVRAW